MRHARNSGEAARGPSAGPPPERISVSMRNALLLRRPRGAGPVAQWLELAAHNRLVGGSSPPGPTTHSHRLCIVENTRVLSRCFRNLAHRGECLCVSIMRSYAVLGGVSLP